jgi:4-diphosphocytidyl-2-C-methyl-D-erythritol kinase
VRRVETLAAAKLNLSLIVRSARHDGLHPLLGRFQSIDWYDHLVVDPDTGPGIEGAGGRPVLDGDRNLAWRAASQAMARVGAGEVGVTLDKRIAVAAGLGGGSADAAATLAATAYALGGNVSNVAAAATGLGSDVPFCLVGGSADVTGVGDVVTPVSVPSDFAVALVVPPIEVSTPAVYAAWDDLGGPSEDPVAPAMLPPSLRDDLVVKNDLTPAAIAVAPTIAEWTSELEASWARPVLLSGSGPSLFAFFVDADEAASALESVPAGTRHTRAAEPVDHGWAVSFDGATTHSELRRAATLGDDWHTLRPPVLAGAFR